MTYYPRVLDALMQSRPGEVVDRLERPAWHAEAACRGMTELFFSEGGEARWMAKRICVGCPVRERCGEDHAHELYGVWGGLDSRDRRTVRVNARRRRRKEIEHGTVAGYQAHRKRGQEACEFCKGALAEYSRRYRKEHPA